MPRLEACKKDSLLVDLDLSYIGENLKWLLRFRQQTLLPSLVLVLVHVYT